MSEPADKIQNDDNEGTMETDDRRSYFRVTDHVELELQRCTEEEEASADEEVCEMAFAGDSLYFKFLTATRALDLHNSQIAYNLKQDDLELFRYLETINRKIELLARLVLNDEVSAPQEANMSPGGVGLISNETMNQGEVVKVRIIFPKTYDVVYAFGHIVYCTEFKDGEGKTRYRVGVEFSKISENNKRIMTKQVFKKQSENLREARQSTEPNSSNESGEEIEE